MADLFIDGVPVAASGSALIPAGRNAAVEMLGSKVHFEFTDEGEGSINLELTDDGAKIVGEGINKAHFGAVTVPQFITNGNGSFDLTVAIYTVGGGADATRIVHYTLCAS